MEERKESYIKKDLKSFHHCLKFVVEIEVETIFYKHSQLNTPVTCIFLSDIIEILINVGKEKPKNLIKIKNEKNTLYLLYLNNFIETISLIYFGTFNFTIWI